MVRRCHEPTCRGFRKYGARGIRVCERWRDSFWSFASDMGERPNGTTLDRKNNNGDYEPGNCRWATPSQQRRNQNSRLHYVNVNGETMLLTDAAARAGVSWSQAWERYSRGFPTNQILSKQSTYAFRESVGVSRHKQGWDATVRVNGEKKVIAWRKDKSASMRIRDICLREPPCSPNRC